MKILQCINCSNFLSIFFLFSSNYILFSSIYIMHFSTHVQFFSSLCTMWVNKEVTIRVAHCLTFCTHQGITLAQLCIKLVFLVWNKILLSVASTIWCRVVGSHQCRVQSKKQISLLMAKELKVNGYSLIPGHFLCRQCVKKYDNIMEGDQNESDDEQNESDND